MDPISKAIFIDKKVLARASWSELFKKLDAKQIQAIMKNAVKKKYAEPSDSDAMLKTIASKLQKGIYIDEKSNVVFE